MTGSYGKEQGRQAGFGYGAPLVLNPGFLRVPVHEDDPALDYLGIGNPMANALQLAPGWYDFGGSDSGGLSAASVPSPITPTYATPRGVRIRCAAGKRKGLCVPIPMASHLQGRRLRFRALIRAISGDDVGFLATLSGRVVKQVWDGTEQLGTAGATAKTLPGDASGLGHLISALPKPTTSTLLADPFDVQDITYTASVAVHARVTTYNRVFDSWRTAVSGDGEITVDVPGTGGNDHDEDHDVFFLDDDIDPASANYDPAQLREITRQDLSGDLNTLKDIDVIFDLPADGDDDDPVHSSSDCVWLCIFPLADEDAPAAETELEVYYCSLDVLDDSPSSGILASGLRGFQGAPFGAGWWTTHALAYPVYRPARFTLAGLQWHGDGEWDPGFGWVEPTGSGSKMGSSVMLPCGAVPVRASLFVGSLGGAAISFGVYHTGYAQLRAHLAARIDPLQLAFGSFSTDNVEEAVPCKRSRIGTLTTTQSTGNQDLVDKAFPDGHEAVDLRVTAGTAGQQVGGAALLVLVDDRLAFGGMVPRT